MKSPDKRAAAISALGQIPNYQAIALTGVCPICRATLFQVGGDGYCFAHEACFHGVFDRAEKPH